MFNKSNKQKDNHNISTIIAEGCQIDGNILSKNSLKIDGIVNGNITVHSSIIMGTSGKVAGDIDAKDAIIHGLINGNIKVEKLEIRSTGKITGDIQTNSMEMEFGAVYNGKVNMLNSSSNKLPSNTEIIKDNI